MIVLLYPEQRANAICFDTCGQFWSADPTDMLKGHVSHVEGNTLTQTPDLYKLLLSTMDHNLLIEGFRAW